MNYTEWKQENENNVFENYNNKKNKKKYLFIGIAVLVVFVIAFITIFKIRDYNKNYHGDIRWGMSLEECKEIADKESGSNKVFSSDKNVSYIKKDYEGIKGLNALIEMNCNYGTLSEVNVGFVFDGNGEYTYKEVLNKYIKEFDKLYGKNEHNSFCYGWKSEKSNIVILEINGKAINIIYSKI